jgi:hypothetical protein
MPIPTPRKGEKRTDFVSRCMSNPTMKREYPDNKQRFAICMSSWRDKKKTKKELADMHNFLHSVWSKVKDGKKWGEFNEDFVISEHAKIVHSLRKMGVKMKAKTNLDRLSKMLEPDHFNLSEITEKNIRAISSDFLYRTHNKVHNELSQVIELNDSSNLSKIISIHDVVADEINRREMIHPTWNNIDKFYNEEN